VERPETGENGVNVKDFFKPKVIHKAGYLTQVNYCGEGGVSNPCAKEWKDVTCKACLTYKKAIKK